MTTDDDRPRAAGGYSDGSFYNADTEDLAGYGRQSPGASDTPMFDDSGYSSSATTVLPGSPRYGDDDDGPGQDDPFGLDAADEPVRRGPQWHGGLDFGLLVLRLVLGGMFVAHGLDKLFGWFTDLNMGATEQMLTQFGFTEPKILAWVLAVSETAGGALLVLGLFTPAGAAAVLGVMANVVAISWNRDEFLGGVELELMFAAAAFTLLFTGPGRVALDRHTPWFRRAPVFGIVFLVIAAGATVVTLLVFR